VDSLWSDLRSAWRSLRRRPGANAAIVATLALGIGANTAVFSVVGGVLLRSLPFPESERLVRIWESGPRGDQRNVAEANFADWLEAARGFEALALYQGQSSAISAAGQAVRAQAATVTRGFWGTLGVPPMLGRTPGDADSRAGAAPVAVVGHAFWLRLLGGERDLSRLHIRLANAEHEVVGVMPPSFSFPPGAEVWTPREIRGPRNPSRSAHNYAAIGRVGRGGSVSAAREEIRGLLKRAKQEHGDQVDSVDAVVLPLHASLTGSVRPALLVLMGAVLLLLLVACANVANLMIAEAQGRLPELAVRTALGASRMRIFRQFFAEALLLSTAGAALGVLVAAITLRGLVALAAGRLPRVEEIGIDASVLGFSAALCVVTALLVGILPALKLRETELREVLKGGGRTHTESAPTRRARATLAASQLALTLTLLVGAGLLARSFAALLKSDLGFARASRLVADVVLPPLEGETGRRHLAEFHSRLQERLAGLPGVVASGGVTHLPLSGREANGVIEQEFGIDRNYSPSYRVASPGYFTAMGIPLLRGRFFSEQDGPGTPHVAVVSQTAAQRAFPAGDVLGRRFRWGNMDGEFETWITVVGVVADVRHQGADGRVNGEIYLHYQQRPQRTATFSHVLRVNGGAAIAPAVREAARALDPEATVEVRTLDEVYATHLGDRRFNVSLIGSFAAIALGLALLGLYGVMISTVASRTQEIGIRMALGAAPGDVVRLLLGDASRMTAAGMGLGLAGALAIGRVLESLLHGVGALDPATFAAVGLFLGGSALVAAWLPARRAARIDPLITLQGLTAVASREPSPKSVPRDPRSMERRARELLAEVAQESRSAASADEVLDVGAQLVRAALGASRLALFAREESGAFRCVTIATRTGIERRSDLELDRDAFVARRLRGLSAPLRLEGKDLDAWQQALAEEGFRRPAERAAEIATLRELDAALVAPVALLGEFLALLVVGPRSDGAPYQEEDDELAMAAAAQMALVLENARLLRRVARQQLIERDLKMASLVQERLLPARAPDVPGLEAHGVCLPARGVAGDTFDFVPRSDGSLAVCVADVAGKGMPAALLTSGLRAAARSLARLAASTPPQVLEAVNETLAESGDGASYATVFQAHFAAGGRRLAYTNAGHNPPLLLREDGSVSSLSGGGSVAGLFAGAPFEALELELAAGDTLIAYTDGVSEAADPSGEEFGMERLERSARAVPADSSARAIAEALLRDVAAFTRGASQGDDMTLVVVKVV